MSAPSDMDRSLAAIRYRAEQSVVWSSEEANIPPRVADALWAAVRDREALLVALDAALSSQPTPTEGGPQ